MSDHRLDLTTPAGKYEVVAAARELDICQSGVGVRLVLDKSDRY
jgi:hypothetical protein